MDETMAKDVVAHLTVEDIDILAKTDGAAAMRVLSENDDLRHEWIIHFTEGMERRRKTRRILWQAGTIVLMMVWIYVMLRMGWL